MAAVKTSGANYQVRWLTPEGSSRKKPFRLKADADRHAAAMVSTKADGVYIAHRTGFGPIPDDPFDALVRRRIRERTQSTLDLGVSR